MSQDTEPLSEQVDATLRALEDAGAILVAGVLALKELEEEVKERILELEANDSPRAEVHPLRSAHAALITARKELVLAEQRTAARLRGMQRQHVT